LEKEESATSYFVGWFSIVCSNAVGVEQVFEHNQKRKGIDFYG